MMQRRSFVWLMVLALVISSVAELRAQRLKDEIRFVDHHYLPFYGLKKARNTTLFQGNRKKKQYFEGWYFKMVAQDGKSILSVIPGISLSADGKEQHAFIQLIDGVSSQTHYFSFPIHQFSFSKSEFAIKIGNNFFSNDSLVLQLRDSSFSVQGTVAMTNTVHYAKPSLFNPGIMGWYRFVPFMECLHGVVSLTHGLRGELNVNNVPFSFENGKGYIEKDWGSSMPSSWIWMQSNHFSTSTTSFMLSVANVPWMRNSFTGFLGFLYHNGQVYKFATYGSSKLQVAIDAQNRLHIKIENKDNTILLTADSKNTGLLKAPVAGAMDRRIAESIDAHLKMTLLDKKGKLIFTDSTTIAGLEMVGDYKTLQGQFK